MLRLLLDDACLLNVECKVSESGDFEKISVHNHGVDESKSRRMSSTSGFSQSSPISLPGRTPIVSSGGDLYYMWVIALQKPFKQPDLLCECEYYIAIAYLRAILFSWFLFFETFGVQNKKQLLISL